MIGPHRTFLEYVSEVLPALGESGVRQSTVAEEVARHPVRNSDSEAAAVVKHDVRMAEVLRQALYARVRPLSAGALAVPDGSYRWRVPAEEVEQVVRDVRAEEPLYDVGRDRVRTRLVRLVQQQAERRSGPRGDGWVRRISRSRPLSALVDSVWPQVRPEQVLAGLLGDPDALREAAEDLLDPAERAAIGWPTPPRSYRSARWSAADLVLLDEIAGLIEHPEGYGHLVVDEAQDLSPMECRSLARRCRFGSMTVLGDLAQGTAPWAARDWSEQLAHLGRAEAVITPLTRGFRLPAAVAELANDLLGHSTWRYRRPTRCAGTANCGSNRPRTCRAPRSRRYGWRSPVRGRWASSRPTVGWNGWDGRCGRPGSGWPDPWNGTPG